MAVIESPDELVAIRAFVGRLLADLGEDPALEIEVVADALLNEKGLFDRLGKCCGCVQGRQAVRRGPRFRQALVDQEAGRGGGARERGRRRPFPQRRTAAPRIRRRRTARPSSPRCCPHRRQRSSLCSLWPLPPMLSGRSLRSLPRYSSFRTLGLPSPARVARGPQANDMKKEPDMDSARKVILESRPEPIRDRPRPDGGHLHRHAERVRPRRRHVRSGRLAHGRSAGRDRAGPH